MSDSNPIETFSFIAAELSRRGLLYLHVTEPVAGPAAVPAGTVRSGAAAIARGEADLVAYGVPFLANPDLPARYWRSAPLNSPDQATFYAGEEKGYIDYPALASR